VVAATKADGFNVFQTNGRCAGQSVHHVHIHIIPRHENDGYHFHWQPTPYKPGEMDAVLKRIIAKLEK
jgi:histidine triad (HIT) family protein